VSRSAQEAPEDYRRGGVQRPRTTRQRLRELERLMRPTPMIRLEMEGIQLFAKLEYQNPVGSINDRVAFHILKAAAARGELYEGGLIVGLGDEDVEVGIKGCLHAVDSATPLQRACPVGG
jgi:hypothetical protein